MRLSKTLKNAEEVWVSNFTNRLIHVERSCPPTENVFYEWRLSRIDEDTGYFGPFQDFGRLDKLVLPLKMVGVGYVYIQCVVEIRGDAASMSFDYGFLRVIRPPLVAKITDITQVSESRSKIKLSAKQSFDAELKSNRSQGLHFTWFCRLEGETFSAYSTGQVVDVALGRNKSHGGCFGFGPGILSSRDKVLELNREEMVKTKKYILKLVLNKGARNASAEYEFYVVPQVSISVK